jgi:putative SOS response-associated peptidase YedK
MCGRYTLHTSKQKLADAIEMAFAEDLEYEPNYNIGPGREVIAFDAETISAMHWGLRTPQNFHINARLETAVSAPRFRDSWEAQRCLIPANGFYEWLKDGVRKQPHYMQPTDESLLYFGALWFASKRSEHAAHCVILTTAAQDSIQAIHDRMPVCIPLAAHKDWLANKLPKEDAANLTKSIPLQALAVSNRVNNIQNNDASLVQESTPQGDDQMQFF